LLIRATGLHGAEILFDNPPSSVDIDDGKDLVFCADRFRREEEPFDGLDALRSVDFVNVHHVDLQRLMVGLREVRRACGIV
jgi:hypothetical protein